MALEGLKAEVSGGDLMLHWPCSQARLTTDYPKKKLTLGVDSQNLDFEHVINPTTLVFAKSKAQQTFSVKGR